MRVGIHCLICTACGCGGCTSRLGKQKWRSLPPPSFAVLVQLILVSKLEFAGDWFEECHQALNHMICEACMVVATGYSCVVKLYILQAVQEGVRIEKVC